MRIIRITEIMLLFWELIGVTALEYFRKIDWQLTDNEWRNENLKFDALKNYVQEF